MPPTDATRYPQLYRAIKKWRWYDASTNTVLSAAFVLNLSRETGVSLVKEVGCSPDVCRGGLNTCFGEFVLAGESIKELGLGVMDDELNCEEYNENHAEITGIPLGPEDDLARENFYSKLADLASLHYDREARYL